LIHFYKSRQKCCELTADRYNEARRMTWHLSVCVLAVCGSACSLASLTDGRYEDEFTELLHRVKDRSGLEAIRALHQQLDDDQDGTIEPSETGDFIKGDLKFEGDGRRQKLFHKKDSEITVSDLWLTWVKSEVYNWTVDQTVDWLSYNVDLPQYAATFIANNVDGTKLPLAASDPSFLSKRLGITNSIHKSKVTLKAMDVVLFGPPKEPTNWLKDLILSGLLIALLSALFWAYKQKKRSEEHLSKMIKDMESLNKAEEMLRIMQTKIGKNEEGHFQQVDQAGVGEEEVDRLREEVQILRGELHRAEMELEDKCWVAPTILQHWLQLTYELECQVYNDKRRVADSQMAVAKDACEKLKRKRSSLVGAFVSTHGRSIDDVDKSILEAKTALLDLTQHLTERSRRWQQIEMLTGVSILSNPGLATLQKIVRYVGGGHKSGRVGMSSRMSNMSLDDLHDEETKSIAASSHVSSHLSVSRTKLAREPALRRAAFEMSRESSKESSNSESDDHVEQQQQQQQQHHQHQQQQQRAREMKSRVSQSSMASDTSRLSHLSDGSGLKVMTTPPTARAATPPLSQSPTLRRMRMIKSLSQDASVPLPHEPITLAGQMIASVSDGALQSSLLHRRKPNQPTLDEIEESCSASDTGSLSELENKKKKKKSFFNFRRRKEKLEVIS